MPKRSDEPLEQGELAQPEFQTVGDRVLKAEVPVIKCMVAYLGAARNKSISIPGRILVEEFKNPDGTSYVRKEAVEVGITCYDFSSHDAKGDPITSRLLSYTHPREDLRGKPCVSVEHVEHLRYFYQQRTDDGVREFEVLARPADMADVQAYIRRSVRARRQMEALYEEVTQGGR